MVGFYHVSNKDSLPYLYFNIEFHVPVYVTWVSITKVKVGANRNFKVQISSAGPAGKIWKQE